VGSRPIDIAGAALVVMIAGACGSSTEPGGGPAASIVVVSGGGQQAEVGTELPSAVVVKARDASDRPIPGQLINFVVVGGGGSVFAGSAETNAQGEARERWTLGTVAGEQVLEARAVDQSSGNPLVFGRIRATAVPGPIKFLSIDQLIRLFVNQPLDLRTVTHAVDQYGNEIPNPPFTASAVAPLRVEGTMLSSTAEVAGANVTVSSGDLTDTESFSAVRDLHELVGSTGGWECAGIDGSGTYTHQTVSVVVDSVRYDEGAPQGIELDLTIYNTGTFVRTLLNGNAVTTEGKVVFRATQVPGGLLWHFPNGPLIGGAVLVSESPLSYAGGNGCYGWQPSGPDNFTLSN
jgi:hypothetical protein